MSDNCTAPRRTTPSRHRPHRLASAAVVGLILVAGSVGGAAAGTLVTSSTIRDDTIRVRDLNYVVGTEAANLSAPVDLTKTPTTVLKVTMSVDDAGGLAVAQADLSVTNTTDKAIEVTVRINHQQDPEHVQEFTTTVPALASETLPASILCSGLPAGNQTVEVRAWGFTPGVTMTNGTLSMVAGPHL